MEAIGRLQWFIYNFGLMGPGTRCFQYQWVPTAKLWVQYTIFNDKSAILLHPGTRWNKNLCAKDAGCAGRAGNFFQSPLYSSLHYSARTTSNCHRIFLNQKSDVIRTCKIKHLLSHGILSISLQNLLPFSLAKVSLLFLFGSLLNVFSLSPPPCFVCFKNKHMSGVFQYYRTQPRF